MSVVPPMVAIITPTKNRLELLCETMNSVQAQTFDAWEHIVVDDGSDDGTAEEVLRRNAADHRVRYLPRTGQRSGANVCRNQGISAASADLIVFLDSDDLLRPGCLERRVEIMQRNPDLDFAVFPSGVFIEKFGDLTGFIILRRPVMTCCASWRSKWSGKYPVRSGAVASLRTLAGSTKAC